MFGAQLTVTQTLRTWIRWDTENCIWLLLLRTVMHVPSGSPSCCGMFVHCVTVGCHDEGCNRVAKTGRRGLWAEERPEPTDLEEGNGQNVD